MLPVLYSTVLIDFLRGRPAVRRVMALRASGDVPATTAVNVEEVVRGLRADEAGAARRLLQSEDFPTRELAVQHWPAGK